MPERENKRTLKLCSSRMCFFLFQCCGETLNPKTFIEAVQGMIGHPPTAPRDFPPQPQPSMPKMEGTRLRVPSPRSPLLTPKQTPALVPAPAPARPDSPARSAPHATVAISTGVATGTTKVTRTAVRKGTNALSPT